MRLFLAIDIPPAVQQELERQITPLKKEYPQFRWVPPENFHITVRFFGEINDVETVIRQIKDAVYDAPQVHLFSLQGGLFIHNQIILHITFQRDKKLEAIEASVAMAFDIPQDYHYLPHLTLARTKIPSKQQYFHLKKKMENLVVDIDFPVDHLTLYESIVKPHGPEYRKVAEFPLLEPLTKSG